MIVGVLPFGARPGKRSGSLIIIPFLERYVQYPLAIFHYSIKL